MGGLNIGRRQWSHGTNMAVLTLAVLGILGVLNYIAAHRGKRLDLTENQRFSLSDQTTKILETLTEDVTITYFEREGRVSVEGQDRLTEYEAASARVKVEYVDPWQSPSRARAAEVTTLPALVLDYAGKQERISNDSEQEITNALLKLTREGRKGVCFVEGQGERDPDDSSPRGFYTARAALERSQYSVTKLLLLREGSVPAACAVVVLAGPKEDLADPAIDALRDYVEVGGKLFVMLEPALGGAQPNLVSLLAEWDIEAGADVVVDVSGMGQLFGTREFTPLVADYPYHEITKDFGVVFTAFHEARSMRAGSGADGVSAQELARTSQDSWAESDLTLAEPIERNEGRDRLGPLALAVAATLRAPESAPGGSEGADASDDPPSPPEARVVAVGDADFASNTLFGFHANQDLFLNMVSWLAQDEDLISIRPKDPQDHRLVLTQAQEGSVALISQILIPFAFVAVGVFTLWRRRS